MLARGKSYVEVGGAVFECVEEAEAEVVGVEDAIEAVGTHVEEYKGRACVQVGRRDRHLGLGITRKLV